MFLGEEARRVFNDAQSMLNKVISDGSLHAAGQLTFIEANSRGDDILVYKRNENNERVHVDTFYGLRQQVYKKSRHKYSSFLFML